MYKIEILMRKPEGTNKEQIISSINRLLTQFTGKTCTVVIKDNVSLFYRDRSKRQIENAKK